MGERSCLLICVYLHVYIWPLIPKSAHLIGMQTPQQSLGHNLNSKLLTDGPGSSGHSSIVKAFFFQSKSFDIFLIYFSMKTYVVVLIRSASARHF